MRRPIVAGNWKMNMTPDEACRLIRALIPLVKAAACDVVICPPYCDLPIASTLVVGTNVHLGAQNVHWANQGAFTGEISAPMLRAFGVEYAIVGHSERRQLFGETDAMVNLRLKAALAAGITPIVCVGESLGQREALETDAFVRGQVRAAFDGIEADDARRIVIAYEPIWAIGTGKTATAAEANAACAVIRKTIEELYGAEIAGALRIQYGGSMNPKNAKEIMAMSHVDGGLIGGASLNPDDFAAIVRC